MIQDWNELAFKRMKSLAGLDALAAKKPELARAWIYARLIVFLIAEQSAGQVPDSSPSAPNKANGKPIALASHQIGPRQRPRSYPRTIAMAARLQRIHAHTPSPL